MEQENGKFVPLQLDPKSFDSIETVSFVTSVPTKPKEVFEEDQIVSMVTKIIQDILYKQKSTYISDSKKIRVSIDTNNTSLYFDKSLVESVSSKKYTIEDREVLINFRDSDKVQDNYSNITVTFVLIEFIEKED